MIYHLLTDITASKSIKEAKEKKTFVVKKREWLIMNNLAIKGLKKNKTLKKKGVVDPATMAKAEPLILLKTL